MGPRRGEDSPGGDHEINLWHEQPLPRAPYDDDDEPTCCDMCMRPFNVILTILLIIINLGAAAIGATWLQVINDKPFHQCLIMLLCGAICVGLGVLLAVFATIPCICQTANRAKSYLSPASCGGKCCKIFGYVIFPIISILLGGTMVVGGTFFLRMAYTVPDLTQDLSGGPGVSASVTITRDANGVPHIVGENIDDVIFAQGFAVAEDRLWQIEFLRLVGQGRLAEYVGAAAVKMDKQTRTLNFKKAAQMLCDAASPSDIALVQRYVDGINFYLDQNQVRPPEFMIMSTKFMFYHQPAKFVVGDTCMLARLLQWQLGTNLPVEMKRWKVFWNSERTLSEINELFVDQTNMSNTILTPTDMNINQQDAVNARAREANDNVVEQQIYEDFFYPRRASLNAAAPSSSTKEEVEEHHFDLMDLMHLEASNAWVARAAGGATSMGASDPHLQITLPSIWYYSHLTFKFADASNGGALTQHDVGGVGLPGIPGIHIGKSTHVSWGITMSMTDLIDLWALVADPANPDTHYLHNGTSVPFTTRTEVIKVKMGGDKTITVKDSLYGPVVTTALELPGPYDMALTSQGLLPDSTSLNAILSMISPTVTNAVEMRDNVLLKVKMPGFSIPITDDQNNLVYTMTGQHVKRAVGHTGRYPMVGNGTFDYLGNIPMNELPTLHIPASASQNTSRYIAAANNKIYPDGYQYTLGYDYAYPFREGRIHQLLAENSATLSTLSTHMTIQRDTRSNYAALLIGVLSVTDYPESVAFNAALNAAGSSWFNTLQQWDRMAVIGSTEASFFWLWARQLLQIPADATKAAGSDYWGEMYAVTMLTNPTAKMQASCAATLPGGNGTCGQAAAHIFNSQAQSYEYKSWGVDLNQLVLKNLMLHGTPFACLLERTTNKDGDFSSIDVADSDLGGDITTTAASSVRQLYDWSAPNTITMAFPGGVSGNPFSKYFQNLLDGFVNDEYVKVTVVSDNATYALAGGSAESQVISP